MKSSLPGYLEYSKSYDKQAVTEPEEQPARKETAKLSRTRAILLIVTLVLLAELAFLVFQIMWNYPMVSRHVTRVVEQGIDPITKQASTRLAAMVDYYSESTTRLAKDPGAGKLFIAGDDAALRAREELLRHEFPKALNVRLLPPGLVSVDMDASPPLSYAALDQMRRAKAGTPTPPMEVHLFGTLQQYISIVRPVMDPASSDVVGYVMLSLSDGSLQDILDDLQQVNGYIELQQTGPKSDPIAVAVQGDIANREGDAVRVVPIAGSRWQLAYWSPATGQVYLFNISVPLLSAVLLISTGLLLLIVGLYRRLVNDSLSTID